MPTNQNAYNSRVTDESLEKRFRDTFRSQGGSELVDDLYASGVIVPVVDFTAAATGQQLAENLQTAWDFSTGFTAQKSSGTTNIITTAGFWQVDLTIAGQGLTGDAATKINLTDGFSSKTIYSLETPLASQDNVYVLESASFVVFVRSTDTVNVQTSSNDIHLAVWYRQIASVNGDLVNPTGFTSS